MDAQFVEILQNHPLSTARRLFVLHQMSARSKEQEFTTLVIRIERLIELDNRILRRETGHRAQYPLRTDNKNNRDQALFRDQRRTQREFVSLIVYILSSYSSSSTGTLLAPVEQQLFRLRDFSGRNDRVGNITPSTASDRRERHSFTSRPAT